MSCDLIVAGDDAQFGQPEINLGVMPGAGGTQRLTRAIGRGPGDGPGPHRPDDHRAAEAEAMGLVSRVVPAEQTLEAALELARAIAAQAPVAVLAAKEAVRLAEELPLSAGLAPRAAGVLRPLRERGSDGRDGGLRREAPAGVEGTLTDGT